MTERITSGKRQLWLLLGIVLLGGALRLADLGNRPYGLFRDEAEKGYNAWALATSGGAVDFTGGIGSGPPVTWRRMPWMINVMGGKTSVIYQYASVPAMWIGGPNVTTTRLTAAAVGTLTVGLLGWLAWSVWGAWAGTAVALVLALSPWHINFSRWAAEGIFVPFFVAATLCGLLGLERGRRWGAPLAGAALGWLFYSYSGAQPFVAAWGLCLLALYWRKIRFKDWALWIGVAMFLLPVIPTLAVRLGPGGSSRLAKVAIWSEEGSSPVKVIYVFIKNYLAHFDPKFLFITGDMQPRHNVAGRGEMLVPDAFLIIIGLACLIRRRMALRGALVAGLLCAPLPAAITREGIPHALRAFAMVAPLAMWAGLGLETGSRWAHEKIRQSKGVRPGYATAFVAMAAAGYLAYGAYSVFYQKYWQNSASDPATQVAFEAGERISWETLSRRRQEGQRVFVNGNIPYAPYYHAFYFRLDPRRVAREGLEPERVYYFDPQQSPPEALDLMMRRGDWAVQGAPAAVVTLPDGRPLLPIEDRKRVSEVWVWVEQK